MSRNERRRTWQLRPEAELCEARQLLSVAATAARSRIIAEFGYFHPERPNTPVLPFAATTNPTFLDPTAQIIRGDRITVGAKSYVAPYAILDARSGFLKIGSGVAIQDNANILANPKHLPGTVGVTIGDLSVIAPNATVIGPSTIGAFDAAAKATYIGSGALIDGATIEPGAYVSALARVGPGVTVPTGMQVLPGANVTTNDEASNPALGKVVALPAATETAVARLSTNSSLLAVGYTNLYQGNTASGANPGTTKAGVSNGFLPNVEGISPEPGSAVVSFEPSRRSPTFPGSDGKPAQVTLYYFQARIIGQASFTQRVSELRQVIRRGVSIRADEGQPYTFGDVASIGSRVSIHGPVGGTIKVGNGVRIGGNSAIINGTTGATTLSDNASIGGGSVISNSTIGAGASIGSRVYIADSTIAAGATIPDGTIIVANKVVRTIQW